MTMKIQGRLTLGIGVLFAMILLLGIQSVSYVRQLSRATGTILADNYNSLQYAGDMLRSLNDIGQDSVSRHALRQSLALQQQNITEVSEKELTAALQQHVASLSDPVTEAEIQTVRADLYRIMEVNMAAIRAKSSQVEERADYVMWWLIVVAALCALVAGAVLVWFPRMVLRPIDELKKGIKEIASHNYGKRLDFTGNREFESVAESFNNMAAKLDEYRRSSLDDLMTAKKRIEAIVDTLHEPIIGLGPDRKILFMNREALAVLNLQAEVVGRNRFIFVFKVLNLPRNHSGAARRTRKKRNGLCNGIGGDIFRLACGLECESQQRIAGKERVCLAEFDMARRLAAAHIVVVHAGQIVVDERICVDKLDSARKGQSRFDAAAAHPAKFESQHRADTLAAVFDAVSHRFDHFCFTRARRLGRKICHERVIYHRDILVGCIFFTHLHSPFQARTVLLSSSGLCRDTRCRKRRASSPLQRASMTHREKRRRTRERKLYLQVF